MTIFDEFDKLIDEAHQRRKEGSMKSEQLTDAERYWLVGLLGGWIFMADHSNNPMVVGLALSILKKIEGVDKVVIVESHT